MFTSSLGSLILEYSPPEGVHLSFNLKASVIFQKINAMQTPGTGQHQSTGAGHSFPDGAYRRLVDRVAHPKVVGVHNE